MERTHGGVYTRWHIDIVGVTQGGDIYKEGYTHGGDIHME